MTRVISTDFPTMATDSKTLWVNPEFLAGNTDAGNLFVLLHEGFHKAAMHCLRLRDCPNHLRGLMHQAADYANNLQLTRDKTIRYPMLDGGLIDERFVDAENKPLNAERIFRILLDEQNQREQENQESDDDDCDETESGDDNSDSGSGNSQDSNDQQSDSNDSESDSQSEDEDASQSGAANDTRPNVATETDELLPAPDDMEDSEEMMDTAKAQALVGGNLPGYLKEMISETINACDKENWRDQFRHVLAKAFDKSDYSMRKPNMRYASFGLFPTLRSPAIRKIAIATDTSGSMDIETLNRCASQIKLILDDWMPLETVSLQFDGMVQCEETLVTGQPPSNVEFVGRGGTQFKPVFDRFESDPPDALIMLTDMMNFDHVSEPDYPVIWCNMSPYVTENNQSFGHYVELH